MANRIYIDGTEYTGEVIGIDDLQVTFALNDSTKTVNTAVSSSLTFIRSAFNYLENKFYSDESGRNAIALITIIVDCCDNKEITLALRGDATTICFQECKIETQAFDDSQEVQNSNKVRSKLIEAEFLFTHPKFRVCIDRGPLTEFWYVLVTVFFDYLQTIADVIQLVTTIDLSDDIQQAQQNFIGCDNYLNAFYIKDIASYSLAQIGMTFESTIFQQGQYEYATWIDPNTSVIAKYCPEWTGLQPADASVTLDEFFTVLGTLYNAEYRIIGNRLIFERVDFFYSSGGVLVDVEQAYNDNLADCPVYSYSSETKYSSGLFQYSKDEIEQSGNYAFDAYYDRVEWNTPFNPLQVGVKEVTSGIAPSRFVQDRFTTGTLDMERTPGTLMMSHDARITRAFPKVIVISPQAANDPDFCKATAVSIINSNNTDVRDYNYPMYYNEEYPNNTNGQTELYNNFWSICDPRETPNVIQEIASFEYLFDCSDVNLIFEHGINLDITTRFGIGRADEIVVDFGKKTITINNVKISSS